MPPAIGRPPASPPPATTTPPATTARPLRRRRRPGPGAARSRRRPPPASTSASASTAGSLEATASRADDQRRRGPKGDPDSYLTSLTGPIGLYHVSTAEVGSRGHLRFGLHGQYFRSSGFLVGGENDTTDTNTRFGGAFTFGFTPHQSIELYGAITSSSNRNERTSEPGRTDPELIKSFGDLVLGGKAVAPVARASTPAPSSAFASCRGSRTCRFRPARRRSGSVRSPRWTCGSSRDSAGALSRERQLLPRQLVQPLQLQRPDPAHHAGGRDVRLRHRRQPAPFRPGRRRASRALHRFGAAAPVRRVPRRDRHRFAGPGVREHPETSRTATSTG